MTPAHLFGTSLAIAIVLVTAHLGGRISRRLGQPAVIGQLAVGFVLGPTVLGAGAHDLSARIFTSDTTSVVRALGTIGLVAYAFVIGTRVDRSHLPSGRRFALVASTVFAVPFLAGLAVAFGLYSGHRIVAGATIGRFPFVLFCGAAISITAFPVLTRIVDDHRLHGTRVGTLAVGSAAVNDVLSWVALGVALLAARGLSGRLEALKFVAGAFGLVLLLTIAARGMRSNAGIAIGVTLAAVATWAMGLHYIFGAFAFGVVVARSVRDGAADPMRVATVLAAILLPLYLVRPGATINLRTLDVADWREILLVLLVAGASKIGAGSLSARAAGLPWHEALSVGVLVNTRGLVELVALSLGASAGILDTHLYAVLVIMAVVTTAATSPALRALGLPVRR